MKSNKPLVYLREFDFTNLSYYESKKYGIERAIYQYVGFTNEGLTIRTSKWTCKNIKLNNVIGKLFRALMKMYKFKNIRQLNKYLIEHTRVLKEYDTIEKAKSSEDTMISINKSEGAKYPWIICLNTYGGEVQISKSGKYIIK